MREFDPYTYDFWIEVDTVAIINITEIVKRLSLNKEGLAKKRKIIGKAKYNDQVRFLLEGTFYAFNFKQDCKFTTSSKKATT
jgi:hypothetical protein